VANAIFLVRGLPVASGLARVGLRSGPIKNAAVFLKERGVWGLGLPPIGTQDIIH